MKVLVTGAAGQLGHDVMDELKKRGHEGIGVDVQEMDVTDAEKVRQGITGGGGGGGSRQSTVRLTLRWMRQKTMQNCAGRSMRTALNI